MTISGKQAKVTYHKFPSESNRSKRKQWIRAIRRDVGKHFKPGKWTKICSLHFKETDFYNFWGGYRTLREDSVPSIFDFDSGRTEKSSSRVSRRSRCRPCPPSVSEAVDESGASEAVDGSGAREDGNGSDASEGGDRSHGTCISDQSLSHAPDQSPSSLASDLSPSSLAPDPSTASLAPDLSSSSLPPDPSTASLTHQSPLPIQESMVVLKAENDALRKRLNELESGKIELVRELELAERRRFCFENVQDSNDDVLFYTGLPSSSVFFQLLNYLSPDRMRSNVVYRATAQNWATRQRSDPASASWRDKDISTGRPPKLSQVNELFLTLVRLRLNLKEHDLSRRFDISLSSVSRVFITWINFMYLRLGMLSIWPDRDTITDTMPAAFKERYPKTTAIVDATEVKVNIPSSLLLQSQTYSSYKSANTLKGLIAISPAGHVTFVSSLYTGSIADKELVERSGFLSLLRRGDEVMADRGFTIDELLAPLGVSLNTPPTLGRRSQMDADQVVETQQIASLRIHIERAIRRVKEFDILSGVIPATLAGSANQIWTVCALLTNFKAPLISC